MDWSRTCHNVNDVAGLYLELGLFLDDSGPDIMFRFWPEMEVTLDHEGVLTYRLHTSLI